MGVTPETGWPKVDGKRVRPDEGFRFNGPAVFQTGSLEGLTATQRADAEDVLAAWGKPVRERAMVDA